TADFNFRGMNSEKPIMAPVLVGMDIPTKNIKSAALLGAVRLNNVVTIKSTNGFAGSWVSDDVKISGVTDSNFDGIFTVTDSNASKIKYNQTGSDANSGSGTIKMIARSSEIYISDTNIMVISKPAGNPAYGIYIFDNDVNITLENCVIHGSDIMYDIYVVSGSGGNPKIKVKNCVGSGINGRITSNVRLDYGDDYGMHANRFMPINLTDSVTLYDTNEGQIFYVTSGPITVTLDSSRAVPGIGPIRIYDLNDTAGNDVTIITNGGNRIKRLTGRIHDANAGLVLNTDGYAGAQFRGGSGFVSGVLTNMLVEDCNFGGPFGDSP
ncbi:MAG: hypothetical protein MUP16_05720, partial [Sedimentisphaerales bacterium]|nr:hypothetical protein [Sedimentisphaerales bacterium]